MIYWLIFLLFSSSLVWAEPIRIYCKPDGIAFEKYVREVPFTDENKIFDVETLVIDESEIPSYRAREQLRCVGGKLVFDETVKTPGMIREEKKKDLETALDEELGRADPDVVTVLRIQREIEKLKGKSIH